MVYAISMALEINILISILFVNYIPVNRMSGTLATPSDINVLFAICVCAHIDNLVSKNYNAGKQRKVIITLFIH